MCSLTERFELLIEVVCACQFYTERIQHLQYRIDSFHCRIHEDL